MCDCEKTMGELLKKELKKRVENEPGFQEIKDSYFANKVYVLTDNSLNIAPIMLPYKIEYTRKAKSSGKVRTYKKEINIRPSFCPFCGVKYEKEK